MEEKKWYVVNTYSGHEAKVKEKIDMRINSMEMQENIFDLPFVSAIFFAHLCSFISSLHFLARFCIKIQRHRQILSADAHFLYFILSVGCKIIF